MRWLDTLCTGALATAPLLALWVPVRTPAEYLGVGGIALILGVAPMLSGTWRWQLVPMYGLLAVIIVLHIWQTWNTGPRISGPLGAGTKIAFTGAWGVALAVIICFPLFTLPQPTGPYAVGKTALHLVDPARPQRESSPQGDRREFMVYLWYPATVPTGSAPVPYWKPGPVQAHHFARAISLPSFLFGHIALVHTHSYRDAPLAAGGPFPVLVSSHGMSSYVEQSTFQYEDLASHGYIVASVTHPYDSSVVLLPDGRHIALDTARLQAWNDEILPFLTKAVQEYGGLDAYLAQHPETAEAEFRRIIQQPLKVASMATWVADLRVVLDELQRLAQGALAGWVDLERLGAFGHSFGGAACVHAAWQDARIKAVLNIDGTQYSAAGFAALEQPLMFIFGTQYGKAAGVRMWELAKHRIYRVTIAGAYHLDFSDFAYFSPLFRLFGLFGPLGADRVHELTRRYTLAFFDRHLKQLPAPILDGPGEAGVEFERKH